MIAGEVRTNLDEKQLKSKVKSAARKAIKAIGYDMNSEPTRSAAMSRARDTGEAVLSGKVTLVQEGTGPVQPGFLLYVPLYRRGMARDTPEQRRQALVGYAYSPYRAHDLFGSALRGYADNVILDIHDGEGTDPATLLYSNGDGRAVSVNEDVRTLRIAGHAWTLRTRAPAGLGTDHLVLWLLPAMGCGLSTLLFHLLRLLDVAMVVVERGRGDSAKCGLGKLIRRLQECVRLYTLLNVSQLPIKFLDDDGLLLQLLPLLVPPRQRSAGQRRKQQRESDTLPSIASDVNTQSPASPDQQPGTHHRIE